MELASTVPTYMAILVSQVIGTKGTRGKKVEYNVLLQLILRSHLFSLPLAPV